MFWEWPMTWSALSLDTWKTQQEGSYFGRGKHLPSGKLDCYLELLKTDVCHVIGDFWKSWPKWWWCFEHADHPPFLEPCLHPSCLCSVCRSLLPGISSQGQSPTGPRCHWHFLWNKSMELWEGRELKSHPEGRVGKRVKKKKSCFLFPQKKS